MGTAGIGGSAIVGSGAFSRVESKRQVKVETVGDDEAYLRLVYNELVPFDCEAEKPLLWVTNQLKSEITKIELEVEDPDDGKIIVEDVTVPSSLEVGEEGEIIGTLVCEEDGSRTVNFNIEVDGEDFEVIAHRTDEIELECSCPEETAWADIVENGEPDPTTNRLNEIDGMTTNRWGWYMPYELESGQRTAHFYAGAAQNDPENGTKVGTVEIDDDGTDLTVTIDSDEKYDLLESHLYADTETDGLTPTAAPGQFPYDEGSDEYNDEEQAYKIPLEDIDEGLPSGDEDEVILALHGVVQGDFDE